MQRRFSIAGFEDEEDHVPRYVVPPGVAASCQPAGNGDLSPVAVNSALVA